MPDKVTHDYIVKVFSALSDDVLIVIGANLDHYLHVYYKHKEIAHVLGIDNNINEIRVFAKLLRVYLEDTDTLESDLECAA